MQLVAIAIKLKFYCLKQFFVHCSCLNAIAVENLMIGLMIEGVNHRSNKSFDDRNSKFGDGSTKKISTFFKFVNHCSVINKTLKMNNYL